MSKCVDEIQTIFSDVLLRKGVTPSTDLLESGLLDSMSFVELLLNLEQRFGYTPNLAELDLEHFRSINKIAELVSAPVVLAQK
jgi:D-alanine--poly(phosphoribitol) ligase subunit 2